MIKAGILEELQLKLGAWQKRDKEQGYTCAHRYEVTKSEPLSSSAQNTFSTTLHSDIKTETEVILYEKTLE